MNIEERFWNKVQKSDGCWIWTAARSKNPRGVPGYGSFSIGSRTTGTKRMVAAHRVAWQLAHGELDPTIKVLHKCDNVICVRPDHLFLGTQADNVADMLAKGRKRAAHGEAQGSSVLQAGQVIEIRRSYKKHSRYTDPGSSMALAAKFGVSRGTITDIVNRAWRHIK